MMVLLFSEGSMVIIANSALSNDTLPRLPRILAYGDDLPSPREQEGRQVLNIISHLHGVKQQQFGGIGGKLLQVIRELSTSLKVSHRVY